MSTPRSFRDVTVALLFVACAVFAALLPANAQSGLRNVPLGFCAMSSMSAATAITTTSCVQASFTGQIAGTLLTVTVAPSGIGAIVPGQNLTGSGVPAGTVVTGYGPNTTGGVGTYQINNLATVSSEAMTTAGLPPRASYAALCAYTQGVVYLDTGGVPTGTPGTGGQGIAANQCVPYNGTLSNLQFIQQTAGAILGVSFYSSGG